MFVECTVEMAFIVSTWRDIIILAACSLRISMLEISPVKFLMKQVCISFFECTCVSRVFHR